MTLFGTPVRRTEDHRLLTAGGTFVADLDLPGVAAVTYVVSPFAHARITSIDVEAARAMPGVIDVVVGTDVDLGPMPSVNPAFPETMTRAILATEVVRFVGEPIVAIVAETAAEAIDAMAEVVVDYDPLPAVVGIEMSATDDVLLFPEAGTNTVMEAEGGSDAADVDIDGCEVVILSLIHI